MAVRSVFLPHPSIEGGVLRISGDEAHHLFVARAEPGEAVEIFDGAGSVWEGLIESVAKRETAARIQRFRTAPADPVELILGLALIRMPAFELALEKAVECGVARICPFAAERSNVGSGDRHDRWRRIVIEAAKQSKRYILPELEPPARFEGLLSKPAPSKIIFTERGGGPLKPALRGSPVLYLIGPEGGWTDRELAAARDSGFDAVSLGTEILKAETAAIVAGAVIRYELLWRNPQ